MIDVLLTGANGQLGWEVARRAAAHGLILHAAGAAELDISDAQAVERAVHELRPRVVVNAAAFTAVDRAESNAEAAFRVNRDGPAYLAAVCARHDAALIHISTDYVFDGARPGAYAEDDPIAPLGVYGASKAAGEAAVRAALPEHVILRTSWVYGAHGANFVKTMLRLAETRDDLRVVDDQRGCPTFAGDLAEAILSIAARIKAGAMPADGYGTFHCAGQGPTTWRLFAARIFELAGPRLGRTPRVTPIATSDYPTPAARPANSVLDCGKLARVHGLRLRPWPEALAEMLDATLVATH
jgi:dTDP-4-dehydrorhamnose reductase